MGQNLRQGDGNSTNAGIQLDDCNNIQNLYFSITMATNLLFLVLKRMFNPMCMESELASSQSDWQDHCRIY